MTFRDRRSYDDPHPMSIWIWGVVFCAVDQFCHHSVLIPHFVGKFGAILKDFPHFGGKCIEKNRSLEYNNAMIAAGVRHNQMIR